MTYGTSHFMSTLDARMYYKPYGYGPADVQRKLDAGEIHIGAPKLKQGENYHLDSDNRYVVTN